MPLSHIFLGKRPRVPIDKSVSESTRKISAATGPGFFGSRRDYPADLRQASLVTRLYVDIT